MRLTSRWNWNLEMLVFMEGGKPENPEKNPRSKDENQQQTQPTYDTGTGNRTRSTLVGGKPSHHCAVPAPGVSDLKNPYSEWIHQIKSKSGFIGFMIRAFLWGTDPKIVHLSSGLPCKFTGLAIFSLDLV